MALHPAPAALPEDLGLVLSTHTAIHSFLSSLGTACTWCADMYTGDMYTLINIKKQIKLKTKTKTPRRAAPEE